MFQEFGTDGLPVFGEVLGAEGVVGVGGTEFEGAAAGHFLGFGLRLFDVDSIVKKNCLILEEIVRCYCVK